MDFPFGGCNTIRFITKQNYKDVYKRLGERTDEYHKSALTIKPSITKMNQYAPQFEKGSVLENEQSGQVFTIMDREYNNTLCDIVYKVQNRRYDFDMHEIPESVIESNIESGDFTLRK